MLIKKIVCPIDFSDASFEALKSARDLAQYAQADLILLHVIPFPAPNDKGFRTQEDAKNFAIEEAKAELQQVVAGHLSSFRRARILVLDGNTTGHVLANAALQEEADLIVIGTHGATGWRRLVLGSATEEVMRLAACPVLTVRSYSGAGAQDKPYSKILCPTDFSAPSLVALQKGGELAGDLGAELSVLHVLEPMSPAMGIITVDEFDRERKGETAQALLPLIEKGLPQEMQGGVKSRRLIRIGKPAEEIVRAVEEGGFDLIVIATYGETGWRHLFFGSVTEEVVRIAPCPVLTIRPPRDEPS